MFKPIALFLAHIIALIGGFQMSSAGNERLQYMQAINSTDLTLSTPQVLGARLDPEHSLLTYVDKSESIGTASPPDLVPLTELGYPGQHVRSVVYPDLKRLMQDARSQGLDMRIISAFRSYQTQVSLFSSYSSQFGQEEANQFSALPGHSEHQLGTAIDFGNSRSSDLSDSFAHQPEGQWLATHAHEYGFVLSYPSGKELFTGYVYEPWHFRYVGKENAAKIFSAQLTINEYARKEADRLLKALEGGQWALDWGVSQQ